jgi:hypothetical protein
MRLNIILSIFLFGFSTSLTAQENVLAVEYYFSTEDFMNDRVRGSLLLEVKKMGDDFIFVKNILDPLTKKHSTTGYKAWAIRYENKTYMHLLYSYNNQSPNLYVQLDVKGRFCLAVMEPDFLTSMDKAQSGYYGAGLTTALVETMDTDGGKLADSTGIQKRIFIIDTKNLSIVIPHKANNAPAEYLNRSMLKWLVGKENFRGSVKDYTSEEIIAIVEDLNRRQKT